MNPVSVFSTEVRSLSRSLVLMSLTSAGSSCLMALTLSAALVIAPIMPDRDFFTAARSAGGFLLDAMASGRED